jgi:hypothetical protein
MKSLRLVTPKNFVHLPYAVSYTTLQVELTSYKHALKRPKVNNYVTSLGGSYVLYTFVLGTGPVSREKNCSALTMWHKGIDAGRWEIALVLAEYTL